MSKSTLDSEEMTQDFHFHMIFSSGASDLIKNAEVLWVRKFV